MAAGDRKQRYLSFSVSKGQRVLLLDFRLQCHGGENALLSYLSPFDRAVETGAEGHSLVSGSFAYVMHCSWLQQRSSCIDVFIYFKKVPS